MADNQLNPSRSGTDAKAQTPDNNTTNAGNDKIPKVSSTETFAKRFGGKMPNQDKSVSSGDTFTGSMDISAREGFAGLADILDYTKGFSWDMPNELIMSARGDAQSRAGYERTIRGWQNLGMATVTSFGDYLATVNPINLIGSMFVEGSYWENIVNNPVSQFLRTSKEDFMDSHQLYGRTVDKLRDPDDIMAEITSSTFLGTEGADTGGFAIAALVPSIVASFMTAGGASPLAAANLGRMTAMLASVTPKALKFGKLGAMASVAGKYAGKTVLNKHTLLAATQTLHEASVEAAGTYESIKSQLTAKMENGELNEKGEAYTEEEIEMKALSGLKDSMAMNSAQLFLANLIQQRLLFGSTSKGLKLGAQIAKSKGANKIAWYAAGGLGTMAGEAVSEAFLEEGAQTATEQYLTSKALGNEEKYGFLGRYTKSMLWDTYANGIMSNHDIQKGMILGGILGGGMGAPGGVAGNIRAGRYAAQLNKLLADYSSDIKQMYTSILKEENGEIKLDENGVGTVDGEKLNANAEKSASAALRQLLIEKRKEEIGNILSKDDVTIHELLIEDIISTLVPHIQNKEVFTHMKDNLVATIKHLGLEIDPSSPFSQKEVVEVVDRALSKASTFSENLRYSSATVIDYGWFGKTVALRKMLGAKDSELFELDTKQKRREFEQTIHHSLVAYKSKGIYVAEMAKYYREKAEQTEDAATKRTLEKNAAKFEKAAEQYQNQYNEFTKDNIKAVVYAEWLAGKVKAEGKPVEQTTQEKIAEEKAVAKVESVMLSKWMQARIDVSILGDQEYWYSNEMSVMSDQLPDDLKKNNIWRFKRTQRNNELQLINSDGDVIRIKENGNLIVPDGKSSKTIKKGINYVSSKKAAQQVRDEMIAEARKDIIDTMRNQIGTMLNSYDAALNELSKKDQTKEEVQSKLNAVRFQITSWQKVLKKLDSSKLTESELDKENYDEMAKTIADEITELNAEIDKYTKDAEVVTEQLEDLEPLKTYLTGLIKEYNKKHGNKGRYLSYKNLPYGLEKLTKLQGDSELVSKIRKSAQEYIDKLAKESPKETEVKDDKKENLDKILDKLGNDLIDRIAEQARLLQQYKTYLERFDEEYLKYTKLLGEDYVLTEDESREVSVDVFTGEPLDEFRKANEDAIDEEAERKTTPTLLNWDSFLRTISNENNLDSDQARAALEYLRSINDVQDIGTTADFVATNIRSIQKIKGWEDVLFWDPKAGDTGKGGLVRAADIPPAAYDRITEIKIVVKNPSIGGGIQTRDVHPNGDVNIPKETHPVVFSMRESDLQYANEEHGDRFNNLNELTEEEIKAYQDGFKEFRKKVLQSDTGMGLNVHTYNPGKLNEEIDYNDTGEVSDRLELTTAQILEEMRKGGLRIQVANQQNAEAGAPVDAVGRPGFKLANGFSYIQHRGNFWMLSPKTVSTSDASNIIDLIKYWGQKDGITDMERTEILNYISSLVHYKNNKTNGSAKHTKYSFFVKTKSQDKAEEGVVAANSAAFVVIGEEQVAVSDLVDGDTVAIDKVKTFLTTQKFYHVKYKDVGIYNRPSIKNGKFVTELIGDQQAFMAQHLNNFTTHIPKMEEGEHMYSNPSLSFTPVNFTPQVTKEKKKPKTKPEKRVKGTEVTKLKLPFGKDEPLILSGKKTTSIRSTSFATKLGLEEGEHGYIEIKGRLFKVTNAGEYLYSDVKDNILETEGRKKAEDAPYYKAWLAGKKPTTPMVVYEIEEVAEEDIDAELEEAKKIKKERDAEVTVPTTTGRKNLTDSDFQEEAQEKGGFYEVIISEDEKLLIPAAPGTETLPKDTVVYDEEGDGTVTNFKNKTIKEVQQLVEKFAKLFRYVTIDENGLETDSKVIYKSKEEVKETPTEESTFEIIDPPAETFEDPDDTELVPEKPKEEDSTGNVRTYTADMGGMLFTVKTTFDKDGILETIVYDSGYGFSRMVDVGVTVGLSTEAAVEKYLTTGGYSGINFKLEVPPPQAPFMLASTLETNPDDLAFEEGFNYYREKFPDMPVEVIVNALIEGVGAAKLDSDKGLLVSSFATGGTFHHEAWHTATLAYTTPMQRKALYNEVRKRFANSKFTIVKEGDGENVFLDVNGDVDGKDLTNYQAEEFLAEQFRQYALVDGKYIFPKGVPETESFFKRVLNALRNWINRALGIKSIEQYFEIVHNSKFTGRPNTFDNAYYQLSHVPGMSSVADNMKLTNTFNNKFFQMVWHGPYQEAKRQLPEYAERIYNSVTKEFETLYGLNSFQMQMLKRSHRDLLESEGIIFSEDIFENDGPQDASNAELEEESMGWRARYERSGISHFETMPSTVKLMFMGLASSQARFEARTLDNLSSKDKARAESLNQNLVATGSMSRFANDIHNRLSDKTQSQMIAELVRYAAAIHKKRRGTENQDIAYNWVVELLERIGYDTEGNPLQHTGVSVQDVQTRAQFFSHFSKHKMNFEEVRFNEDGEMEFYSATESSKRGDVLTEWKNGIQRIGDVEGRWKPHEIGTGIKSNNKELTLDEITTAPWDLANQSMSDIVTVLDSIGFTAVREGADRSEVIAVFEANKKIVKAFINNYLIGGVLTPYRKHADGKNEVGVDTKYMFDDSKVRSLQEIKDMINLVIEANGMLYAEENSHTIGGKRRYSVAYPSYMSVTVGNVNEMITGEASEVLSKSRGLFPYQKDENGEWSGSLYLGLSDIVNMQKILKEEIVFDQYITMRDDKGELNDITDITESERISMIINGIVSRKNLPIIRTGTRAVENFVSLSTQKVDMRLSSDSKFYEVYINEIANAALAKNDRTDIRNYNENGESLLFFDGLGIQTKAEEKKLIDKVAELIASDSNVDIQAAIIADLQQTGAWTDITENIDKVLIAKGDGFFNYLENIGILTKESSKKEIEKKGKKKKTVTVDRWRVNGFSSTTLVKLVDNFAFVYDEKAKAYYIQEPSSESDRTLDDAKNSLGRNTYMELAYSMILSSRLLGINPHYFKSPTDVIKRMEGGNSIKTAFMSTDDVMNHRLDTLLPRLDGKKYTPNIRTIVGKEPVYSSTEMDEFIQTTVGTRPNEGIPVRDDATHKKLMDAYTSPKIKPGDGQGIATLDHVRHLYVASAAMEWTETHDKIWNYEQQLLMFHFADLNKKGGKHELGGKLITPALIKEKFAEHFPTGTPKEPQFKGEVIKRSEFGTSSINNMKVQGYSPILTQNAGTTYQTRPIDFTKLSLAVAWPSTAIAKGSAEQLLKMMNSKVDTLVYESGKKAEFVTNLSNFNLYDESDLTSEDYYEATSDSYGIQVNSEAHVNPSINESKQLDRLLFNDLDTLAENGIVDREKFGNMRDEYYGLLENKNKVQADLVLADLGMTRDESGRWVIENRELLLDRIKAMVKGGHISMNTYDGIEAAFDETNAKVYFDTLPMKDGINSRIISITRKKVVKVPVKGQMFIQEASAIYKDDNLKFYRKGVNKNGDPVLLPMQVRITMNWRDYNKILRVFGTFEKFNQALKQKDSRIPDGLRYITGNRIPADDHHSMDNMEVVEYLPPWTGERIVLPAEIVVKSGADFDFDKLSTYLNQFRIVKDDKGVRLEDVKYYTKFNKKAKDNILKNGGHIDNLISYMSANNIITAAERDALQSAMGRAKELGHEIRELIQEKRLAKNQGRIENILDDDLFQDIDNMDSTDEITADELTSLLFGMMDNAGKYLSGEIAAENEELLASIDRLITDNKDRIEEIKSLISATVIDKIDTHNIPAEIFNSKEAIDNRMNQIRMDVLSDINVAQKLLLPTDTSVLKAAAEKLRTKNGKLVPDIENYNELFDPEKMNWISNRLMNTTRMIGIVATAITNHATTTMLGMSANEDVLYDLFDTESRGVHFNHVYDENGSLISESLMELLNGNIDATANFSVIYLNLLQESSGIIGMLLRMGGGDTTLGSTNSRNPLSLKDTINIVTHPFIDDYLTWKKEGHFKRDIIAKMIEKYNINGDYFPAYEDTMVGLYNEAKYAKTRDARLKAESKLKTRALAIRNQEYKFQSIPRGETKTKKAAMLLESIMYYDALSGELTSTITNSRQDANIPQSKAALTEQQESFERALRDQYALNNTTVMTQGLNGPYINTIYPGVLDLMKNYHFVDRPEIKRVVDSIMSTFSPLAENRDYLREQVEGHALAYFVLQADGQSSINARMEELMIGTDEKPSVAKRLIAIKSNPKYAGNIYFQELIPVINEHVRSRDGNRGYDYIRVNAKRRKPAEIDEFIANLKFEYNEDTEIRQFIDDLVAVTILQTGFASKRTSPEVLLPGDVRQRFINDRLNNANTNIAQYNYFYDTFFRNMHYNSSFVPKAKIGRNGVKYDSRVKELYIPERSKIIGNFEGAAPFIVTREAKWSGSRIAKEKKANPNVVIPMSETFWTIHENPDARHITKVKGGETKSYIYKPTYKLGDSNLFESKPEGQSILEVNHGVVTPKVSTKGKDELNVKQITTGELIKTLRINAGSLSKAITELSSFGTTTVFGNYNIKTGERFALENAGFTGVQARVREVIYSYDSLQDEVKESLAELFNYTSVLDMEVAAEEAAKLHALGKKMDIPKYQMEFITGINNNKWKMYVLNTITSIPNWMTTVNFSPNARVGPSLTQVNQLLNEGKATMLRSTTLEHAYYHNAMKNTEGVTGKIGVHVTVDKTYESRKQFLEQANVPEVLTNAGHEVEYSQPDKNTALYTELEIREGYSIWVKFTNDADIAMFTAPERADDAVTIYNLERLDDVPVEIEHKTSGQIESERAEATRKEEELTQENVKKLEEEC